MEILTIVLRRNPGSDRFEIMLETALKGTRRGVLIGATRIEQLEDILAATRIMVKSQNLCNGEARSAVQAPCPAWMQPKGIDMTVPETFNH